MRIFRTRPAAALATALLAGGLLTACGTADSDSDAGSGEPGPGVTAETVRVGFITLKASTAGGGSGFNVPDYGDLKKQVQILVDDANGKGGIAGRTIEPVIREFDSSTDSVQVESDLCTSFTEDEKVFAVVLLGQREPSARSCYKEANTLMVDAGGVGQGQQVYESLAPYYWAPSFSALEPYSRAMLNTLETEGFFGDGIKLGLFVEKSSGYRTVVDEVIKPGLSELGVTDITEADFDVSSNSSLGASAGAAVNSFKAAGVDRVMFLGRGDMVGFFTSIAAPQQYAPRLALGSFDDPQFASLNPIFYPPRALEGAVGVGVLPATDGVAEGFPAPGAEKACIDTLKAGGQTIPNREGSKRALLYCDAVSFLQAVGDKIGDKPLNAQSVAVAAAALGDQWQAAASIGTSFGEGIYAGASEGRTLKFENDSFTYTSDPQALPR